MRRERARPVDDGHARPDRGPAARRRKLPPAAYDSAPVRSSQRAVVGAARKLAPTLGLVLLGWTCLLVVVLVGQLHGPRPTRAQADLIAYFHAKVTDPGTRTVRFEWGFRRAYRNDAFTCTLDVNANEIGVVEQSIPDCDQQTTSSWSYEDPGTYEAALVATRRAGGADRATVTVRVGSDVAFAPIAGGRLGR